MKLAVLLLLSFTIVSCASDEALSEVSAQPKDLEAYRKDVLNKVMQLTNNKSCQATSDCQLIGIGARPCGGPERYLVYSSAETDEPKVRLLAAKYNQMVDKYNKEKGVAGICMVTPEPSIACQSNQCVALDYGISNQL